MKKSIQIVCISLMILAVSCTSQYTESTVPYEQLETLTIELPKNTDGTFKSNTITEDGGTLKLDAKRVPVVTASLEWTSSDTGIASVDKSSGDVTALANGTVTITVKDKRSKKEATQEVVITGQVVDVNDVLSIMQGVKDSPVEDLLFLPFIKKAGLLGASTSPVLLQGKEAYTIFFPSDKALESNSLGFDSDMMKKIVKYHIVKTAKPSASLGTEATTLYVETTPPTSNTNYNKLFFSGTTVKTKATGGIEATINAAETYKDKAAANGVVIHVIDKLLIPENLKSEYDSYVVHPTEVKITTPEASLKIDTNGGTFTPTFSILPATAYQKAAWSIKSGSEFAEIDGKTGEVTALKNGTVVIVATALVGSAGVGKKYSATASVVITNQSDLLILEGEKVQINELGGNVKLSTNAPTGETVTWSILGVFGVTTNENNLITVSAPDADEKVTVRAKTEGLNGTVVVQAKSSLGKVAKITVEVIAQIPAVSIKIKGDENVYNKGNEIQLTATVYSDAASTKGKEVGVDQHVTWSSSAATVATVDANGKVIFISTGTYDGTGTVTITATSKSKTSVTKTFDITY